MTAYRGGSYEIPFSGAAVPGGAGNVLSDEFSNSRPQLEIVGTPVPGAAQFDAKWTRWDPGEILEVAAVLTQTQMGLLTVEADKQWAGMLQPLPLPTVVGQTLRHQVTLRCFLSRARGLGLVGDAAGPVAFGLILGEDLIADPETAPFYFLGPSVYKSASDPQVNTSGEIELNSYLSYDAIGSVLSASPEGSWPACSYLRVRIAQVLEAPGDYATFLKFECGTSGIDWVPLGGLDFEHQPPISVIGFGLRSQGSTSLETLYDFFRVVETTANDGDPTGTIQQLGAI